MHNIHELLLLVRANTHDVTRFILRLSVSVYIFMCVHKCVHVNLCIYIYVYVYASTYIFMNCCHLSVQTRIM